MFGLVASQSVCISIDSNCVYLAACSVIRGEVQGKVPYSYYYQQVSDFVKLYKHYIT